MGRVGKGLWSSPPPAPGIHHQVASKKQKILQCLGVGMGAHPVVFWEDLKHTAATQSLPVCGHGAPAWALPRVRLPVARLHTGVQPKPCSAPPPSSADHHLCSTDIGWLLAGVKVVYLLALFVSQENQRHSNPEVYMLKGGKTRSIQETTKQKIGTKDNQK